MVSADAALEGGRREANGRWRCGREGRGPTTIRTTAENRRQLTVLHQTLGAGAEALAEFRTVAEIYRRIGGERHPDYWQTLETLAVYAATVGTLRRGGGGVPAIADQSSGLVLAGPWASFA